MRYVTKRFLDGTDCDSSAMVVVEYGDGTGWLYTEDTGPDISIKIKDCYHYVELTSFGKTEEEALAKVQALIDVLSTGKELIKDGWAQYRVNKAARDA